MNHINAARAAKRHTGAARTGNTEAGSASLEMAVNVVGFGLLLALVLLAGRVVTARQVVETAAYDAARTASITRDITLAPARAQEAASASLTNQDLTCMSSSTSVDTSRYSSTPGEPSQITVTVSCEVNLTDLALGPITHTVSRAATSPVDSWRSTS
ncbi:TadE-like protein [Promicromonospora umidemergens]|uniref:TadE-like domain-containing protein n=2 Tax=Promicromonospora TaxID=43676 RepID=A0ABP8XI27_9MICO|nr:TadE/TadG family type IV pilus assembly protein [Promicromonospora umidemergens]MCP2284967.1 TadE-like protein [Promicromonospora umidemergens]